MINHRSVGALALIAILASPAAAAAPLQPTSKWVVDFAANQCTAARSYGTEDKPLTLVLKPAVLGDVMTLAILRNGTVPGVKQHMVAITLDNGPPINTSLLAFSPKGQKRRVEMVNLPLDTIASVRRSSRLSLDGTGIARRSFALNGMAAVTKALDICLADLQKYWNVGGAVPGGLKAVASSKKPLSTLFEPGDYPQVALRGQQSGMVAFALLIDENGKLADCTVVETSGVAMLDSQSCAIINERAAFLPAVGADGKPARSSLMQRVRWQLP